jgi:putative phosphoribosyl transferase
VRVRYRDRSEAGRRLAAELSEMGERSPVVVAVPRGGVPVAAELARTFAAPLEIMAVRKLGAPGNPELGVGALAEEGTAVLDPRSAAMAGLSRAMLDEAVERESAELRRRVELYRQGRAPLQLGGRDVILVDDGLATGLSDLAALRALRKRGAARVVVAAPVGSGAAISMLEQEADRVLCVTVPERLGGVGLWYRDFSPVSDEEVVRLIAAAAMGAPEARHEGRRSDAG